MVVSQRSLGTNDLQLNAALKTIHIASRLLLLLLLLMDPLTNWSTSICGADDVVFAKDSRKTPLMRYRCEWRCLDLLPSSDSCRCLLPRKDGCQQCKPKDPKDRRGARLVPPPSWPLFLQGATSHALNLQLLGRYGLD